MNRREFSKWVLTSLLVGGSAQRAVGSKNEKINESIIIVGAGVAGLGVAMELRKRGYQNIKILEARDRLGGRVWTSKNWGDAPVDLGASWIHGIRRNPIAKLARQAGVETRVTDFENNDFFNYDGSEFSPKQYRELSKIERKVAFSAWRARNSKENTLRDFLDRILDDLTPEEYHLAEFVVDSIISKSLAADADEVSPTAWDFGDEFGGDDVLFPGGYFDVFKSLYTPFDIRLQHDVETIETTSNGVKVITNEGNFGADRVVVTLPIGVLKSGKIRFEPTLPNHKKEAIDTFHMGCLNKVYFKFSKAFWNNSVEGFSYVGKETGHWSQWLNLNYYGEAPVLLAFNSGKFGREIEDWSDNKIIDEGLKVMKRIHGQRLPELEDYQITRWASDPFSFGSYSYVAPGVTTETVKDLAAPVGDRLFFAGEATSLDYPSTVHGAYLSGIREANRIARL